jgi:phospholipid transport system substrate-binding protein
MIASVFRGLLLSLLLAAGVASAQQSPEALVKSTADEVLAVMRQNKDPKTLIAYAEQKIVPYFDFERMTRLAVGRPWVEATPEQRRALEQGFRSLLVSTYAAAITNGVTPADKIEVKQSQGSGDDVLVRTVVHRSGGQPPVAVNYRVERKNGQWMVYDVIVEEVSLIQTYRGSFSSEIARSGIDGLIRLLEQKTGVKSS